MGVGAQNIQTSHEGDLKKKQDMLNKSHPLSIYKANSGKSLKKMFGAF